MDTEMKSRIHHEGTTCTEGMGGQHSIFNFQVGGEERGTE